MTAAKLRTVVRVDHEDWQTEIPDASDRCRTAAECGWTEGRRTLAESHDLTGPPPGPVEISIVLSDDDTVRDLNRDHRGKDTATDVLSFPGDTSAPVPGADVLLGDVILAWQTVAEEAKQAGKPVADHMSHLVVHGVLHLLGYDHEREDDATVMERLEATCMAALGLPDPYAPGDEIS